MECIFTCPTCGNQIAWDNQYENEPNCPRCPVEEKFDGHRNKVIEFWDQIEEAWDAGDLRRATQYLLEILRLQPVPEQVAWKNLLKPDRADVSGVPEDVLKELPEVFSGSSSAEERKKRIQLVERIQKYVTQPFTEHSSGVKTQDSPQHIIEKRFEGWEYHTVKELDQLCSTLPVLPRTKSMEFFGQAGRVIKEEIKVVERQSGKVFESLSGIVSSSDRKDFTVTYSLTPQNPAYGILMIETYDDVIGILFCVARISENSFITHGFTQRNKSAIKGLRDVSTVNTSLEAESSSNKEETSRQTSIEQIKTFASAVHKDLSQEDRVKISLGGGGSQFFKEEWENLLKNLPAPLDLKGADFSNCSFINANFNKADLENCNFSGCFIAYSFFDGANLNGSCFDNSRIPAGFFDSATIRNASFNNVKFGVTQFINSDLSDCSFNNSEWIVPPFFNEKTKTATASFSNCKIKYSKNEELGFEKYLNQEQLSHLIIEKSKTDKKGCYIATATYGNYNHPNVILFANFRDNILSKKIIGRCSIKLYYLTSPHLAKIISRFSFLKKISKNLLDGIANRLSSPL